ncbi:uncharacterized protein LOC121416553 [Lytechinus variegatus]|uniref:uncharacterized protein LOC121416553 n=1 Tax=Lytechinus variegatus TaxID=7654 RepID=UPI001BB2BCF0|nr:uncharacterized protein LOC121416553 [Lytechinus variegatus]
MGAKLVVFQIKEKMIQVGDNYAAEYISAALGHLLHFWVGCTDADVEGLFECEDGTQLSLSSKLWNSKQGYPRSSVGGNGVEDCVYYLPHTYRLEDTDCQNASAVALCEVDPLSEPPTAATNAYPTTQGATTSTTPGQTTKDPTQPTTQGPATQTTTMASIMQNVVTDLEQDGTTTADEISSRTTNDATTKATPLRKISKSNVFLPGKDNSGRSLIGYCLTGHVMETVRMVSQLQCAMMCADIVGCQSFNYIQGGVCELNFALEEGAHARFFSRSDGCTYFGRA